MRNRFGKLNKNQECIFTKLLGEKIKWGTREEKKGKGREEGRNRKREWKRPEGREKGRFEGGEA